MKKFKNQGNNDTRSGFGAGLLEIGRNNKNVVAAWKRLVYCLVGNTITTNDELNKSITGITISPKKSFCIIKVWLSSCSFQNPKLMSSTIGLQFDGCIFKKHIN